MRSPLRRLASLGAVLGLVLGVAVAPAASAAVPSSVLAAGSVAAAGDWKYDPSKSKWRKYAVNITSSVLGSATPNKFKAEQIANNHAAGKGVPSGEALNAQYGYTNLTRNANGELVNTAPRGSGTYDDYILDEYDKQKAGTSTRKGIAVPATKTAPWMKAAFGGAGALSGYSLGTSLGGALAGPVTGWLGINDAQASVCNQTSEAGIWGDIVELASGTDCSLWDMPFQPNIDAGKLPSPSTFRDGHIALKNVFAPASNTGLQYACYNYKAPTDAKVDTGNVSFGAPIQTSQTYPGGIRGTTFALEGQVHPSVIVTCKETYGGTNVLFASNAATDFRAAAGYVLCFSQPTQTGAQHLKVAGSCPGNIFNTEPDPGITSDPFRSMECVVTYTDGTVARQTGATYRESDGVVSPPSCPPTPASKVPDKVTVNQKTEGGTGSGGSGSGDFVTIKGGAPPATQVVYEQPTTNEFKDWVQKFPECGTGTCTLDLLVKSPTGDNYASCFDLEDGCAGWNADPNKASTYTCRYGVKEVKLSECNVYSGLFEPGRVAVGAPYSDPMTGEWSGGQNAPSPDKAGMGQAIQDPTKLRSCTGLNITGFDPVGFVMRPIQCALEWAFVPRPVVVEAAMAGGDEAWQSKPPAVVAAAVQSINLTPSAQGCKQTVSIFSGEFRTSVTPIDNCAGSWMEPVTHISKVVTSCAMIFLVLVVLRRQVSGMVGYQTGQS